MRSVSLHPLRSGLTGGPIGLRWLTSAVAVGPTGAWLSGRFACGC